MNVPLLDLNRENRPLLKELRAAIDPLLENSQFVLGKTVADFEESCSTYFELGEERFALGVSSGTDALLLALMLLELPAGTEVITTPFTFFATAGCIHRAGLKPRFVDIDEATFNIDPNKVGNLKAPEAKAIIPVHLYGQAAEMNALNRLGRERGWAVIEDAAQAMGARYKGKVVGTLGDMAEFSFYPTKNLGALGDAGLLIGTSDLQEKAARMRVHGMQTRYEHIEIGGNFRIDAIQAAALSVKLPHLRDWQDARRANATRYGELFGSAGITEDQVTLPVEAEGCYHVYNQYVVRIKDGKRDSVKQHLDSKKIGSNIFYPSPLHLEKCFSHLGHKRGDFPVAEKACEEVLALPIYPFLKSDEQEFVVKEIKKALS